MRVVEQHDWPKQNLRKQTGLVAFIENDFDAIADLLSAKPKTFTQRATKTDPQIKLRTIFLILTNGAPASLTEYFEKAGKIELDLQVERDQFAFDDDFAEVVAFLKLKPKQIRKFEGNFTWLPNRDAKRVSAPEEPLPEDWWNHVQVAPPPKPTPRK